MCFSMDYDVTHHVKEKPPKAIKGTNIIRKLHSFLPRQSALTIYKQFVRPNLDFGNAIYD